MEPLTAEFINSIKRMQSYKKQIVNIQEIPAQGASFGELEKPLPGNLQTCMLNRKIKLYTHQTQAINLARTKQKRGYSHTYSFRKNFSFQHTSP